MFSMCRRNKFHSFNRLTSEITILKNSPKEWERKRARERWEGSSNRAPQKTFTCSTTYICTLVLLYTSYVVNPRAENEREIWDAIVLEKEANNQLKDANDMKTVEICKFVRTISSDNRTVKSLPSEKCAWMCLTSPTIYGIHSNDNNEVNAFPTLNNLHSCCCCCECNFRENCCVCTQHRPSGVCDTRFAKLW